jgi:hypothetical protein
MCRYCRQFDPFSPQARWGDDGARQVLIGYAERSVNKAGMMMGQAKNRGSQADREQQAKAQRNAFAEKMGLEQRSLAEIKEELGLSPDAHFHGYAVHIPSSDEFLLQFSEQEHATGRQWSKNPGMAKCFEDFAEAYTLTRSERGELVVGIFETESQYFVSEVT